MARKLLEVLEEYELVVKIGWLVTDNASSMIKTLPELQNLLNENGYELLLDQRRVRCIYHVIQLITMTFLSTLKLKNLEEDEEEEEVPEKTVIYRKTTDRRSLSDDNSLMQSITKIRDLSGVN